MRVRSVRGDTARHEPAARSPFQGLPVTLKRILIFPTRWTTLQAARSNAERPRHQSCVFACESLTLARHVDHSPATLMPGGRVRSGAPIRMASTGNSDSGHPAAADAALDTAAVGPMRWRLVDHKPLVALFVVNIFYYIDRYVLNMLIEPIRLEFGLTDGEIGLLTGLAFAISYALMTIPFGRMTDRYNRVRILAVAVSLWSLSTAAFGLARSYVEMLVYRVGVAFGEAGGFIPIQSLVGDLYRPSWRSTAMGILLAGGSIGQLMAYAAAGMMNDAIGWRMTFIILGLAGVGIGPLLWMTIREPQRGASEGLQIQGPADTSSTFGAIGALLGRPAMRGVIGGMTVASDCGLRHADMASHVLHPTFRSVHQRRGHAHQRGHRSAATRGHGARRHRRRSSVCPRSPLDRAFSRLRSAHCRTDAGGYGVRAEQGCRAGHRHPAGIPSGSLSRRAAFGHPVHRGYPPPRHRGCAHHIRAAAGRTGLRARAHRSVE